MNKFSIILLFFIAAALSSCSHSHFLISTIRNSYNAGWNKDSSEFAFISTEKIYRPATGLAKFPDGGRSKIVFKRIAVYHYKIKNKELTRISEYKGIDFMSEIRIRGLRIIVTDTSVLYKLPPISNYTIEKAYRFADNHNDSVRIGKNIEQTKQAFQYNFKTKTISVFDTVLFNKADTLPKAIHGNNAEDKYINKITLTDRGIFLENIYPQSIRKYKQYILEGRGSKDIRDAIVDQVFAKELSVKEIKNLMTEMTEFKQNSEHEAKTTVDYKKDAYSYRYNEYYDYMIKKLQDLIIQLNNN